MGDKSMISGPSVIDPFFGSVVGAVGNVLGAAVSTPPAGPAISSADPMNDVGIDFSDWTVATGGGDAQGSSDGLTFPSWLILAGLALAAVVAVKWAKAKR